MPRNSGRAGWRTMPRKVAETTEADNGSKARQHRRFEIIESLKRMNMEFVRDPTKEKALEWQALLMELDLLNFETIDARVTADNLREVRKDLDAIMRGEHVDVSEMQTIGVLEDDDEVTHDDPVDESSDYM